MVIFIVIWACARSTQDLKPSQALAIEGRIAVPAKVNPQSVVRTAKQFLGTRYRFGAHSAQATDCSGFVQMVFKKQGINLPRSSFSQAQLGHYIDNPEDLKPADLVFFETYRKGPSHVGIYLGNNRFIHASTGQKKVVITSLRSKYYEKRYIGAKRLL